MNKSINDTNQNHNNREVLYWRRKYMESCKEISKLKEQTIRIEQKLQQYFQLKEIDGKERPLDGGKTTDNGSYYRGRGYASRDSYYDSHKENSAGEGFIYSDKKDLYKDDGQTVKGRGSHRFDSRVGNWGEVVPQSDNRHPPVLRDLFGNKNPELVLVRVLDCIMNGLGKVMEDIRTYRYDLLDGAEGTNTKEVIAERDNVQRGKDKRNIQLDYGVSESFDDFNVDTNLGGGSSKGNHKIAARRNRLFGRGKIYAGYRSDLNTDTEDGRSQAIRSNREFFFNRNIGTDRIKRKTEADLFALKKKVPRSAVVLIRSDGGSDGEYSVLLKKARKEICIEKIGISQLRTKKAFNGGVILEIFEEDAPEKAKLLAEKLHSVFENYHKKLEITCPVKKVNLALTNIIEIPSNEEIIMTIAKECVCDPLLVQVGRISRNRNGSYTIRVRCPIIAAVRLLETRFLRLGWSTSKIVWLKNNGTRCLKCWATGHISRECPLRVDRRGLCFRCGESSHMARDCSNPMMCVICKERNYRTDHLAGGPLCMPVSPLRIRDT